MSTAFRLILTHGAGGSSRRAEARRRRSLTNDAGRFNAFVDALEGNGFDSLWLSERITGDCPDPLIGLAVAAGRTKKLKLGTSVQVLPGRKKLIVDTKNGRRHLVLLDDGVEISPPAMMPVVAPQRPREDE